MKTQAQKVKVQIRVEDKASTTLKDITNEHVPIFKIMISYIFEVMIVTPFAHSLSSL